MLYTAVQLQNQATETARHSADTSYNSASVTFRDRSIQCLCLARYTRGGPYVLEALIMLLTGEFFLCKATAGDAWLSISMVLHLAVRMGYHRDPDHFGGLSIFEGEMRRRVWATILQIDLSFSLETGLPRTAIDAHSDTREPRNLQDYDLDEDSISLPISRPESEWTPVLALITRRRLLNVLGPICDLNTNVVPATPDKVAQVGAMLEHVHKCDIPPALRWAGALQAITDSPIMLLHRISVETTYHKSRILLYRRTVTGLRLSVSTNYADVARRCVDSALTILSFQEMLHEESQPHGRLSRLRWKAWHILYQDVLLATSVLCLYLQDYQDRDSSGTVGSRSQSWRRDELRDRLAASHRMWLQLSPCSPEAAKIASAVDTVLERSASCPGTPGELDWKAFLADIDHVSFEALAEVDPAL
jgi:hypothetical protein